MSSMLSTATTVELQELCCPLSPQPATPPATTPLPLRALTPTPMQPEWHHLGVNTLTRLRRIEWIEVVKSSTTASSATSQEYTINIYHEQPQSHIPTIMYSQCPRSSTRSRASPPDLRSPDLQVVHSASQFCSLRNIAHSCVTTDDHTSQCDACQCLSRFMTQGDGRPMAFVGVTLDRAGDASVMLTGFATHLLNACQSPQESDQAHGCRGQRRIALALQEFLFRS